MLITKAIEEKRKEQAFELYKSIYPYMREEDFISFEEFYREDIENTCKDKKSCDEILKETKNIYDGHSWEVS